MCFYVGCSEELEKDVEFEVVGDVPEKAPAQSAPEEGKSITNGKNDSDQPSTSSKGKTSMVKISLPKTKMYAIPNSYLLGICK